MKHWPPSLAHSIPVMLFVAGAVAALLAFTITFLAERSEMYDDHLHHAQSSAIRTASEVEFILRHEQWPYLDSVLTRARMDKALQAIVLIDEEGAILYSSPLAMKGKQLDEVSMFQDIPDQVPETRRTLPFAAWTSIRRNTLVVVCPIQVQRSTPATGERTMASLALSYDLSGLTRRAFEKGGRAALPSFLALTLFSVTCGLLLHITVTRRVQGLLAYTVRSSKELSGTRVETHAYDEISRIYRAVNRLVSNLHRERQKVVETERRLRLALEGSQAAVWDWFVQTGETIFDERWAEIVGYTLEALAPISVQTWLDLCHPEDLKRSNDLLERCFRREQEFYVCECRMRHRDGHWVWVLDRGRVVDWDKDGRPLRMTGTHTDIHFLKTTVEALEASEILFRTFFEHSTVGMAITSLDKQWIRVNLRLCAIFGYSREELEEMTWTELTHPEDLEADLARFEQLCAGEIDSYAMDKRFLRRDGEITYAHISATCVRHPSGEIDYFIAAVQNITARVLAEKALKDSESRFRQAVVESPFPLLMHAEDGEILLASHAWTEITGYTPDDIPDIRSWTRLAYKEEDVRVNAHIERLYSTHGRVREGEYTISCRDGSQRVWDFSSIGLGPGADGRKVAISMASDVTDRKRSEKALEISERRMATLIGNLQGMVYRCRNEPDWPMEFVSQGAKELTGYPAEAFVSPGNLDYGAIIYPEDRERVWRAIQAHVPSLDSFDIRYRIHTAHGRMRWVWERGTPIRDEWTGELRLEGIIQDVTTLIETQTSLATSQRRLRKLISLLDSAEEAERKRIADYIHDEVVQNLALCNMRLGSFCVEYGEYQHSLKPVKDLIAQSVDHLRQLSFTLHPPVLSQLGLLAALDSSAEEFEKQHGISCCLKADSDLPALDQNVQSIMYRAAREILRNVAKHAAANNVWITCAMDQDNVLVRFRDDGRGFASPDANAYSDRELGYGLFSIRERFEYLGGALQIRNLKDGGAEVTISLPKAVAII